MPRGTLRTNVIKKPWVFLVTFKDGREEEVTVEAESYHNAVYSLPSGKKTYKLLKGKAG